ncbi:MAG: tryptophan 7-halogenase, partial [Bryobacterales bacterium]|nr:tryptophan 7-halogenase [Bryobacterales bacterium]
PCFGNQSAWGDDHLRSTDFLSAPDGHGWHLDRARFDQWLRAVAQRRGAHCIGKAQLDHLEPTQDGWHLRLSGIPVNTRFLIDATGRFSPLARRLGASRTIEERLICTWITGRIERDNDAHRDAGFTFIEAVEQGWWYTAPIPGTPLQRILAFHTHPQLPPARTPQALIEATSDTIELRAILTRCCFTPGETARMMVASGSTLSPCAGQGWLAAGDAAVSFDPLSAQGLLNALFTGLAGAMTAAEFLQGDHEAIARYRQTIAGIDAAYQRHRTVFYQSETRWSDAPFWRTTSEPNCAAVVPPSRQSRLPSGRQ